MRLRGAFSGRGRRRKWLLLALLLIMALSCSTPVSARYSSPEGTNNGIASGDTVYTYERNLNFSVFRTPICPFPTHLAATASGTCPENFQQLDASSSVLVGSIDAQGCPGRRIYRPYNISDNTWGTAAVFITDPDIGNIRIQPYADVTPPPTDPPLITIPYDMNVQFLLEDTNLNYGNFAGPWYEYDLTSQSRTYPLVINGAGNPVSLHNLQDDPTLPNATLSFSMRGQNVSDSDLASPFSMKFQTTLDSTTAFPAKTLIFYVKKYNLSATFSPSSANMGDTVTLTVNGKPYTWYTIVINNMTGAPEFPVTGTYDAYTSKYNVTVHPDSTGTVKVSVYIPETGGDFSTTTRFFYATVTETNNPSQTTSAQLAVGGGTTGSVILTKPNLGNNRFFSVGDTVPIWIQVGSQVSKLYLFITGPNICPNGAKPSEPWVCAIDGDNSTFDELSVSPETKYIIWETMKTGLAEGTYRLFGMTTKTGYINRTFAAGNAEDYVDIDLMDPSINAKFPEEAPGFFAQGDYVVSLWTARGSPGKELPVYTGKIRWYILGFNYRYTGITTRFPLIKTDELSPTTDPIEEVLNGKDWPGYSGLIFGRDYSAGLTTGDYYVIYQHPMRNNLFDIYPAQGADYTGSFDTILSNSGWKKLDLSTMQTSDALTAMLDLLDDPNIDDSMLSDRFSIESPLIAIDPLLDYEVGDTIPVTGTTNLEETISYPYNHIDIPADKVILTIFSSDLYNAGKTQSTYQIYSTEGSIGDIPLGAVRREISFSIPDKITAQMKPGEYVAVISCEDIKYTTEITFVLYEQGYRKKNGIAEPEKGPEFSTQPGTMIAAAGAAGLVAVATRAETMGHPDSDTAAPATLKSPVFCGLTVAAVALALIVFNIRVPGRPP